MQKNVDKNISDPLKFLKTIYLGDRGVTSISMDSVRETVKLSVFVRICPLLSVWGYCISPKSRILNTRKPLSARNSICSRKVVSLVLHHG